MPRRWIIAVLLCLCLNPVAAQDLGNLQIHGFATQGFLFSSNNNYLTMDSSSGSLHWTEGALTVTDPLSDNLRVGIQLHMFQMGQFGRSNNVVVDWVSGDYKVDDQVGFRAGKIKIPMGLFNDSQDVDPLFLWVLLPQSIYPIDNRDFNLAVLGGELYGSVRLSKRGGRLQYGGYVGENSLDSDDGYLKELQEAGLTFSTPPNGKVFGGDVRWVTPWQVTVGASEHDMGLDGSGSQATFHLPYTLFPAYYAQWQKGRWQVAAEYWRSAFSVVLTAGPNTARLPVDTRSWYPMVSYRVKQKLQVGSYYSHSVNKAADSSQSYGHSKDWVVSGRYDFNEYFYGKVEGHFLHGTGLGYYATDNPNGLKPNSNMLAARVGFSF